MPVAKFKRARGGFKTPTKTFELIFLSMFKTHTLGMSPWDFARKLRILKMLGNFGQVILSMLFTNHSPPSEVSSSLRVYRKLMWWWGFQDLLLLQAAQRVTDDKSWYSSRALVLKSSTFHENDFNKICWFFCPSSSLKSTKIYSQEHPERSLCWFS